MYVLSLNRNSLLVDDLSVGSSSFLFHLCVSIIEDLCKTAHIGQAKLQRRQRSVAHEVRHRAHLGIIGQIKELVAVRQRSQRLDLPVMQVVGCDYVSDRWAVKKRPLLPVPQGALQKVTVRFWSHLTAVELVHRAAKNIRHLSELGCRGILAALGHIVDVSGVVADLKRQPPLRPPSELLKVALYIFDQAGVLVIIRHYRYQLNHRQLTMSYPNRLTCASDGCDCTAWEA